jgi:hypothetical protein
MGRKFWLRVAGGAVAIFVIGLAFFTAARSAKTKAKEAIAEFKTELGGQIPAVLAGMRDSISLSLDGAPLGRLRRLTIERPVAGELPSLAALVQLEDASLATRLEACDLVPESGKDLHRFRCAAADEPGLQQVGVIEFLDQDLRRPLRVNDSLAAELRQGEPYNVDVDLTTDVDAVVSTSDKHIVRIKADSTGAHIVVNDKHGRKVVRMKADSTGFSLNVDSTGGK